MRPRDETSRPLATNDRGRPHDSAMSRPENPHPSLSGRAEDCPAWNASTHVARDDGGDDKDLSHTSSPPHGDDDDSLAPPLLKSRETNKRAVVALPSPSPHHHNTSKITETSGGGPRSTGCCDRRPPLPPAHEPLPPRVGSHAYAGRARGADRTTPTVLGDLCGRAHRGCIVARTRLASQASHT